ITDMTITARMLTQDKDGIGGYLAHPDGAGARPGIMMVHHAHGVTADYKIDAYRLAGLGFNVFVPSLFNMFGILGTNHIGQDAHVRLARVLRRQRPHRDARHPGSAVAELRRQRPARRVALLLRRQPRLPPPRQRGLPAALRGPRLAARHRLPAAPGVMP